MTIRKCAMYTKVYDLDAHPHMRSGARWPACAVGIWPQDGIDGGPLARLFGQ